MHPVLASIMQRSQVNVSQQDGKSEHSTVLNVAKSNLRFWWDLAKAADSRDLVGQS